MHILPHYHKKMKKLIFAFTALLLLASCSKEKSQVKEFANATATLAAQGNVAAMAANYPAIASAQAINTAFGTEATSIEEQGTPGVYIVYFGDNFLVVKVADNKSMAVTDSKGLLAMGDADRAFALGTGLITQDMTDAVIASRLAYLPGLHSFVYNEYASSGANALVVKGPRYVGGYMSEPSPVYDVTNPTDETIAGNSYTLISKMDGPEGRESKTIKGKDVAPHSSVTFNVDYGTDYNYNGAYISSKPMPREQFEASYTPRGDEFSRFAAASGLKL